MKGMTPEEKWDLSSARAMSDFQEAVVESYEAGKAGSDKIGVAMGMSTRLFLDNVLNGDPSDAVIAGRIKRTLYLFEMTEQRMEEKINSGN